MRLVVVGADGVVDMAVPRGRGTDLSWPLGRARFLEVGESPHYQVYWLKSSVDPPLWLGGPWSEAAYRSLDAWLKSLHRGLEDP